MKATLFLCRQLIHRIQTEWVLLMLSAVPLIAWGCIYFCMPLFVKYLDEYEGFMIFFDAVWVACGYSDGMYCTIDLWLCFNNADT